ncbi:alpha/beta fold hydrolase [Pseudoprimorskyibacter insulae]|uniref:2-succinyl-6-hydroxy-2, 4-cyclohexadiene-1-carboxylate synthase n=1 Tax=Pseudoprimorskyibacter insulae TaxID=1695997 RepID=A0A2R8AZW6_9RHOB|nr:alpha/beta fold hydrolase [Pseudoprimorskyibacter insulae]SPF81517.1 2-succinyl-6-hydroxy-2, 4-cyclohexadiene-1-carboxylate synthase [Pseudoprimorskyibacter insulae]
MKQPVTIPGALNLRRLSPTPGGAPVLALHSLGLDGDSFAGMAQALAPTFEVWAFDQRGHGAQRNRPATGFDDLVADAELVIDHLSASQPVHLIGHSMGGAVAATAAARRGGRARSVMTIATPARGMPAFLDRATAQKSGLEVCIGTTMSRWFEQPDREVPAVQIARAALARMTPAGFDASWHALAEFPGFAEIAASLPALCALAYCDDRSTPPAVLDDIADSVATSGGHAQRVDITDAGHMGLLEKPGPTAEAFAMFVANLPVATASKDDAS